jgi:hypothetical protein
MIKDSIRNSTTGCRKHWMSVIAAIGLLPVMASAEPLASNPSAFGIAGTGAPNHDWRDTHIDGQAPRPFGIAGTGAPADFGIAGTGAPVTDDENTFGIAGTGQARAETSPATWPAQFGIAGTGAPTQRERCSTNSSAYLIGLLSIDPATQSLEMMGQALQLPIAIPSDVLRALEDQSWLYVEVFGFSLTRGSVYVDAIEACPRQYVPGASYVRLTAHLEHTSPGSIQLSGGQSISTTLLETGGLIDGKRGALLAVSGTQPNIGGVILAGDLKVEF